MKTFWAFVLCVLGFYARGDQLTIPGTNIVNAITLNGGDLATALTNKLLNAAGSVSASNLATGAATNNIGYQPVDRAGDTMTGTLSVGGSGVKANYIQAYTGGATPLSILGGSSANLVITPGDNMAAQIGADAASPLAVRMYAAKGVGTDKNGSSLTIAGGQSTGSGRGGDLIFRTSITTNSASTTNFYSTRAYENAKFVDLTDAQTNLLFKCSLAPSTYCGGQLVCTLFLGDGSDFKSHTSHVSFTAVNKAGTITGHVLEAAQLETHVETAGTAIADTYALYQDGANNVFYITVTPTQGTVITPTTYRAKWFLTAINSNDPATITPP